MLATRALHSFLLLPTGQHLHSYPTSGHLSQCCPCAFMCLRYSQKIIPNVLIPNYALLAIYPVTQPGQLRPIPSSFTHGICLHISPPVASQPTLRDQKSHFTNAVWIQTSSPEHVEVDNAAKAGLCLSELKTTRPYDISSQQDCFDRY